MAEQSTPEISDDYEDFPITPSVSRWGWRGVIRMGESAAKAYGIPWDDKLVAVLANCLTNYEQFKKEFGDG